MSLPLVLSLSLSLGSSAQEAVKICVQGRQWDRAQGLADKHLPHLSEEVRKRRTASLVDNNDGDELVSIPPSPFPY